MTIQFMDVGKLLNGDRDFSVKAHPPTAIMDSTGISPANKTTQDEAMLTVLTPIAMQMIGGMS